jgi:hypothetical protein
MIHQAKRACKAEFDVPLALIVIDTTIKAAGYKKSENDAVEVNEVIVTMENYAHAYQCFVLFIDHMGKDEDKGARGSSDKPSSVDTYAEIRNGKKVKRFYVEKVKGEKGHMEVEFTIVGVAQDGQPAAKVQWGKWDDEVSGAAGLGLQKDDKLLYECIVDTIANKGQSLRVYESDPGPRKCVRRVDIRYEFYRRKGGSDGNVRTAFLGSWKHLLHHDPLIFETKSDGSNEDKQFVFLV